MSETLNERPNLGDTLGGEAADDLLSRGFSRRQLGRIAAVFGSGLAVASAGRAAWASAGVPDPAPTAKVRIGANECWTGPLAPGAAAAAAMIPFGNRYAPHDERGDFIKAVMSVEKVPYDHVAPWPGSSMRVAGAHRMGATFGCRQGGPPPLDRLEGPLSPRHLAPAKGAARGGAAL